CGTAAKPGARAGRHFSVPLRQGRKGAIDRAGSAVVRNLRSFRSLHNSARRNAAPPRAAIGRGTMPMKIVSAVLTAAAILIGLSQVAGAAEPKWPPGAYKYVVIEQDLKDALVEFGRNINVPVKVSDEVKGKLRGELSSGTAEDFFKRLVASYGL